MNRLKVVTGPTVEPVTLAEAKLHLRVTISDDDALITTLITAARQAAETYLGRVLNTQTVELWMDDAPSESVLTIPVPPLLSIVSVKYYGDDGIALTFSAANYLASLGGDGPGRVALKRGFSWPTSLRPIDSFVVQFTAGYGATSATVPAQIVKGILNLINTLYENREDIVVGTISSMIDRGSSKFLLDPYRVLSI